MNKIIVDYSVKKEINDLNERIISLKGLLNDYKRMAAGDFKRNEIESEIEELMQDRNLLLSVI